MNRNTAKGVYIHSAATGLGLVAGLLVASGKSHSVGVTIGYMVLGVAISNALAAPITYMALKNNDKVPSEAKPQE
jgi:hypothetical protein